MDDAWPDHLAVGLESTRVVWFLARLVVLETSAALVEPLDLSAAVVPVEVEVTSAAGVAAVHADGEGVVAVAPGVSLPDAPTVLEVATPVEAQVVLPRAPLQVLRRV